MPFSTASHLTNQAQTLRGRGRPGTKDDFAKDQRGLKPEGLKQLDRTGRTPDFTTAQARPITKGYHKMVVQARKAKQAAKRGGPADCRR